MLMCFSSLLTCSLRGKVGQCVQRLTDRPSLSLLSLHYTVSLTLHGSAGGGRRLRLRFALLAARASVGTLQTWPLPCANVRLTGNRASTVAVRRPSPHDNLCRFYNKSPDKLGKQRLPRGSVTGKSVYEA